MNSAFQNHWVRTALIHVRLGDRATRHLDAILEARARRALVRIPGFLRGVPWPDLPLARARLWQSQLRVVMLKLWGVTVATQVLF